MSRYLIADPGAHPPLQSGWVDAPHYRVDLGDFRLASGGVIEECSVSFAAHGDLADETLPVVVALCAIGSTHHRLDFLIGRGKALDPRRARIIAIDAIGNGLSRSPSNSATQPGMAFPRFTIRDMVRSQKLMLDALGIGGRLIVAGASMGGMQALQWGVEYPALVDRIVALTPMAKTAPWATAVNEAARGALAGRLPPRQAPSGYPDDVWDAWVPVMQLLAMRTPDQIDEELHDSARMRAWMRARTQWWKEQRFDPVDWIYQSWAYDEHDVGSGPAFGGDTRRALESISAETLIIAPPLDLYNPVESARYAARHIPKSRFLQVDTQWGHLAASASDEKAAAAINEEIRQFLGWPSCA